ncbi:SURF1 family protein [Microbulbifer sp. CAU 1566]|uniref:SURF1 family protein n=1 Tax=Microbulbifer sp. CAU 1566 TaxID=2933269 RepID=UPI002006C982|nr:SURF1 family protein [Microbulbifer sp. CAU 1566]MCK7598116.1 SURF1 family protein [Microbulbifer sp. CAU 1566]
MTVPKSSLKSSDKELRSGAERDSTELEEQSQAASVTLISSWPLSILCLCFFPLLLGLGVWQLERAAEKARILNDIDERLASQPQPIQSLQKLQQYTPVRLLGVYTDHYFYLDNRTRNGRVGYEVLQSFVTGQGEQEKTHWLINRGWLPAGSDRTQLPEVPYPLAAKVITGFLYPSVDSSTDSNLSSNSNSGSNGTVSMAPSHSRVQSLQVAVSGSPELTQPAWHIRISADSDTAFTTGWQLVNIKPQKHWGYAVQWFSMAAALLILWVLAATNIRILVREKWFKKAAINR